MSQEQFETLAADVAEIKQLLKGDPNNKPGLVIRLDRVEQKVRFHYWIVLALITNAIAVFFK